MNVNQLLFGQPWDKCVFVYYIGPSHVVVGHILYIFRGISGQIFARVGILKPTMDPGRAVA